MNGSLGIITRNIKTMGRSPNKMKSATKFHKKWIFTFCLDLIVFPIFDFSSIDFILKTPTSAMHPKVNETTQAHPAKKA